MWRETDPMTTQGNKDLFENGWSWTKCISITVNFKWQSKHASKYVKPPHDLAAKLLNKRVENRLLAMHGGVTEFPFLCLCKICQFAFAYQNEKKIPLSVPDKVSFTREWLSKHVIIFIILFNFKKPALFLLTVVLK